MTKLINSEEASDLLGVSARTVLRYVAEKRLKPYQKLPGPNGAYLFREATVRRFADEIKKEETDDGDTDGAA